MYSSFHFITQEKIGKFSLITDSQIQVMHRNTAEHVRKWKENFQEIIIARKDFERYWQQLRSWLKKLVCLKMLLSFGG